MSFRNPSDAAKKKDDKSKKHKKSGSKSKSDNSKGKKKPEKSDDGSRNKGGEHCRCDDEKTFNFCDRDERSHTFVVPDDIHAPTVNIKPEVELEPKFLITHGHQVKPKINVQQKIRVKPKLRFERGLDWKPIVHVTTCVDWEKPQVSHFCRKPKKCDD